MRKVSSLIDMSVWTGQWPFTKQRFTQLVELRERLESLQVAKAFVAPTEAILEQDPSRANKELLAGVKDDFFSPVPIVDLSYANWDENVARAADDARVQIVKLLPNYHMYEVHEKRFEPLVKLTGQHRLIISIQMRVEDMRGQHPLMLVKDIDIVQVVKMMAYFPEQRFIVSNLYIHEVPEALLSLDNVWIDISSLEEPDTVKQLKQNKKFDKVLFATHSPFYIPEASFSKLKVTDATQEDVDAIAFGNAAKLLNWR
ncbi:amidohydrolase family protein [Paenibacillus eucommiae]|uniref:TIM-barrel fold metal-dependent hydrolase n=1 Tax=Paenibacillus eucommiae TaxID=1355755 RepID=A0ABS4ILZ5_9BACL|nr:amidohydrolase family protein [Paenibacillus eucommiae]MBP1988592.1 putative TIM-barrel fold metal-dependent hydrolase [Paenibacillus eucommiae]